MEKTKADLICSKCHRNIIIGLDAFTPIYGYFLCSGCFPEADAGKPESIVDYIDMRYGDGENRVFNKTAF